VSVTASSTEIQTEQASSAAVMDPPTAEEPAAAAKAPAAEKRAGKAKKGEGRKSSKGSKQAKDAAPEADARGPSVAAHPRAARGVARARGWAGLGGFLIAGYLSLPTGTLASAGLRALIAGIVCYVVAWAGAVFLWRRLVILEIQAREHALQAAAGGHDGAVPTAESPGARAAA
jgi:hypothetical protein